MIPVRQSEALRTGALAGAGQVGAVVGTPGDLLPALIDIFTHPVSRQAVAALTAALTTHLTQILTTTYTKTDLIRSRCVNAELVTAHLVILTLVNILTRGPVRTKQEPVRTHAEHLGGVGGVQPQSNVMGSINNRDRKRLS